MSTASKVAAHKAKHPELYCLQHGCLWRIPEDVLFCPRHRNRRKEAPYIAQARQIATMYNTLAQAEARPDLEEQ